MKSEKLIKKINYIHDNPVKQGYIDEAEHCRYSMLEIMVNLDEYRHPKAGVLG